MNDHTAPNSSHDEDSTYHDDTRMDSSEKVLAEEKKEDQDHDRDRDHDAERAPAATKSSSEPVAMTTMTTQQTQDSDEIPMQGIPDFTTSTADHSNAAGAMALNDAFSALESMRTANLELELGARTNPKHCVTCLKRERLKGRKNWGINKRSTLVCLVCAAPTCARHTSKKQKKNFQETICVECAYLFSQEFLIDLIQNEHDKAYRREAIEQVIDRYDRALIVLKYTGQYVIDSTIEALGKSALRDNRIGLGSSSVGLVSGVTGAAAAAIHFATISTVAAAAVLTPAGPPLLIASIVFGGTAAAASSGSEAVSYYSEPNKLANRIMALHKLVNSLLKVTVTLKMALTEGKIDESGKLILSPVPEKNTSKEDDDESTEADSNEESSVVSMDVKMPSKNKLGWWGKKKILSHEEILTDDDENENDHDDVQQNNLAGDLPGLPFDVEGNEVSGEACGEDVTNGGESETIDATEMTSQAKKKLGWWGSKRTPKSKEDTARGDEGATNIVHVDDLPGLAATSDDKGSETSSTTSQDKGGDSKENENDADDSNLPPDVADAGTTPTQAKKKFGWWGSKTASPKSKDDSGSGGAENETVPKEEGRDDVEDDAGEPNSDEKEVKTNNSPPQGIDDDSVEDEKQSPKRSFRWWRKANQEKDESASHNELVNGDEDKSDGEDKERQASADGDDQPEESGASDAKLEKMPNENAVAHDDGSPSLGDASLNEVKQDDANKCDSSSTSSVQMIKDQTELGDAPSSPTTKEENDSKPKAKSSGNIRQAVSRTASNTLKAAGMASAACGVLSIASIIVEAKNMTDSLERMRSGSLHPKAEILLAIKDEIDKLPDTDLIAKQLDLYLQHHPQSSLKNAAALPAQTNP